MPAAAAHAFDAWEARASDWPIRRAYLAALKDLGLSDGQIASYFRVRPEDVSALRASYGIVEDAGPITTEPPRRRRFSWRRRT